MATPNLMWGKCITMGFDVTRKRKPAPQAYFDNRVIKENTFIACGYKFVFAAFGYPVFSVEVQVFSKDNRFVTCGMSFLHPNDTYDKKVGGKLALTDALQAMSLTREERREVWSSYFKATKGETK